MKAWLAGVATVAIRRPRLAIAIVVGLVVAGGLLTVLGPLDVSTSRRALISKDEPGQARLLAFFDRFGRPDATVFVISGATQPDRREVARRLIERVSARPGLAHRVLGRLDLRLVAEVLALNHPRMLDGFAPLADRSGATTGLADLVGALERRILANLDGDAQDAGNEKDLARMVPLVRAFDAELRGEESKATWIGLAEGNGLASHTHLDELGYLVAGDGARYLVIVFPELTSDEGKDVTPFIDDLRAVRDRVVAEVGAPGLTADLTGLPALAVDELRIVGQDIQVTSILASLGIFALLLLAFRSIGRTFLALVPMGASVVITLGFVELVYDDLNLITSSFQSVLMGLGVEIGVHLLHRHQEERRHGHEGDVATRGALLGAGPGVTAGAAVGAIAFLTTATTEFTAFSELGIITAVGLVIMLACTFLVIPPLLRVGARVGARRGPRAPAPEFKGGAAAAALVARFPRPLLFGGVALTIASVVGVIVDPPAFDGRYFDFLPKDAESNRALKVAERDRVLGPAIVNLSAASIEEARALTDRLRATPEVGAVHSPTDLLPPLTPERLAALRASVAPMAKLDPGRLAPPPTATDPAALAAAVVKLQDAFDELSFALESGGRNPAPAREAASALGSLARTLGDLPAERRALLGAIERDVIDIARRVVVTARDVAARGAYTPSDLPPLFRVRYASKDGQAVAVHAYPSGNIWERGFAQRFADVVLAIQPEASGLALDIPRHEAMITGGFERAALYAAILAALWLLLVFRSLTDTLLALFPVAMGWLWMLGIMQPVGLTFDIANMVALPLVLGVSVDAGAHMVLRWRESQAEGAPATLRELVRGTGAAVMVSSLTNMVGFAALVAGSYGAVRSLGLLVTIGIAFCMLASVLVLPALLVVLGKVTR